MRFGRQITRQMARGACIPRVAGRCQVSVPGRRVLAYIPPTDLDSGNI